MRASDRLLAPLRPRPGFTPIPRHDRLREVATAWRAIDGFGRLGLIAKFEDGALQICELRARPVRMRFESWDGDDELALAVLLKRIRIAPPAFVEKEELLVDLGIHGLARRFQRGLITALGVAYPGVILAGGEFRIGVDAGRWIGEVTTLRGAPVLCCRTFVEA